MKIKMTIIKVIAGIAVVGAFATAAPAATLSIVGGKSAVLPSTYNPNCGGCIAPAVGDPITVFGSKGVKAQKLRIRNTWSSAMKKRVRAKNRRIVSRAKSRTLGGGGVGGGLMVDGASSVKYTFVGKQAGAKNTMFTVGGAYLKNRMAVGSSIKVVQSSAGPVEFLFQTKERRGEDMNGNNVYGEMLSIINYGSSEFKGLKIAFGAVFNAGRSVYAFFGDGRGDNDFDDMVVRIDISAVPVPAAGLLLVGAIGGLGAMGRRKKKKAA